MKKVYQRIIDPTKGDCFKCCICSLLELDYDEVPNFVEIEDNREYTEAIKTFFLDHGYKFEWEEFINPKAMALEQPTAFCFEKRPRGGCYCRKPLKKMRQEEGIDGLFLAAVYSPGHTNPDEHPIKHLHAVICDKDFNIVHDPNENYKGIREYPYSYIIGYNGIRSVELIRKIEE